MTPERSTGEEQVTGSKRDGCPLEPRGESVSTTTSFDLHDLSTPHHPPPPNGEERGSRRDDTGQIVVPVRFTRRRTAPRLVVQGYRPVPQSEWTNKNCGPRRTRQQRRGRGGRPRSSLPKKKGKEPPGTPGVGRDTGDRRTLP